MSPKLSSYPDDMNIKYIYIYVLNSKSLYYLKYVILLYSIALIKHTSLFLVLH